MRAAFVDQDAAADDFFIATGHNKFMADLYGLARRRLFLAGVSNVYGGEYCTRSDADIFYSYRRDSTTGRMASLIWLE